MTNRILESYANQLESDWKDYQSENDWGSGEDRIYITEEIEKEYYENAMFDDGLSQNEMDEILILITGSC